MSWSWIEVCKHSQTKERAKHQTAELRLDELLSQTEAEGGGGEAGWPEAVTGTKGRRFDLETVDTSIKRHTSLSTILNC